MESSLIQIKREQLQRKIIQIFQEEMEGLPEDLREILADDLVTAFINRMMFFNDICSKIGLSSAGKRSLNP